MEGSEEALRNSAETRQVLKRTAAAVVQEPPAKKPAIDKRAACTHVVALPDNWEPPAEALDSAVYGTLEAPAFPKERYAKQYDFELDSFQSISVACLERGESVMVAAHTSAGKTVVAEYAIAKALANKQRVVYTSPLKALSNQKYRELQEEFQDVGLMTGDVSINEGASCIIMTTEILRSMLYRGSEMLREIVWVIFDEIHYMQDRDRGVVWEETIIGLPAACRMAFLSATLSNAHEFAGWIASLHHQPCHVVTTEYRPTPLEHFGLPCTTSSKSGNKGGIYKIFDQNGKFSTKMWQDLQAAGMLKEAWTAPNDSEDSAKEIADKGKGMPVGKPARDKAMVSDRVADVLRLVQDNKLYPMIIFSFQRAECEAFAMACFLESQKKHGRLDFTTAEEKEAIEMVFDNAVKGLGEDAELKAVQNVKRFLLRGFGVHHGGLIPVVKELVEILFQESLVKVLFATETFAMGLNMPARTVMFTTYIKHDGLATRTLTSGEYIQMSGRAGRRGTDPVGYVIMLVEDPDKYSPAQAKALICGRPMPLMSRFKLSYYTLLNLTKRLEGGMDHMEHLIQHSFQQYQHDRQVPLLRARLEEINGLLASPEASGLSAEACEEYIELRAQSAALEATIHAAVTEPRVSLPYLTLGRLVRVKEGATDWGWGVVLVVSFKPTPAALAENAAPNKKEEKEQKAVAANWQAVVMLAVDSASKASGAPVPEPLDSPRAEVIPVPVPLPLVVAIGKDRLAVEKDLRSDSAKRTVLRSLKGMVLDRYGGATHVPAMHPLTDLKLSGKAVKSAVRSLEAVQAQLEKNAMYQKEVGAAPGGEGDGFGELKALAVERASVQQALAQSQLTDFKEQVAKRRRVLRRLGHLTAENMLTAKGKAAAEIDTADELMTTELMFNAVWKKLDTAQLVGLLSCLVPCHEKDVGRDDDVPVPRELASAVEILQSFAKDICAVTNECGLELTEKTYIEGFTANLMVPLYKWSKGASFAEISEKTSIYEGTLIRCARRLMELMTQIVYAAEQVGEAEMKTQMQAALESLQRGIMFCGSLYL